MPPGGMCDIVMCGPPCVGVAHVWSFSPEPGMNAFCTILYIPAVVSVVAVAILWASQGPPCPAYPYDDGIWLYQRLYARG